MLRILNITNFLKLKNVLFNGHIISNRHQSDVDVMSICKKQNFDEFLLRFDALFRWNFDGWKVDVVLTCFLQRNFDQREIEIVLTYIVRRNFGRQKVGATSMYFFNAILVHSKLMQLQPADFDICFLISFWYFKNESCLVSLFDIIWFRFTFSTKVTSFYLETSWVIIECLSTHTPAGIWSYQICPISLLQCGTCLSSREAEYIAAN